MLIEFCIHESTLHQCLTIVEYTIHLDGCDILSQGSELTLLNGRHLSFGIEHIHVDAINTKETVGYSRTSITRSGYQYVDLLITLLLTDKVLQQSGHETGTHILEGEGRTVKEFEGVDAVFHLNHRTVE